MKKCQKCNFQNAALIDYCWQCGSHLPDNSNAGNYYQAQPTQEFYNGAQNNYAPNYQPRANPTNYGRIFLVLGSIFVFLLMISGAGAVVAYRILHHPLVGKDEGEYFRTKDAETPKDVPTEEKPKSYEPSANFEKLWVDYNVTEKGRLGMRIHVKFSAYNLKDVDSYLAIYFEKADGTKLKTTNKKFAANDGQVAVYRSMKPSYEDTIYDDLDVFMPYDELKLSRGKYNLKMDADVIYKNGDLVEHLDYEDFQYEKFRK
jgi:hypothetical protein